MIWYLLAYNNNVIGGPDQNIKYPALEKHRNSQPVFA